SVSRELMRFHRAEQMKKLRTIFGSLLRLKRVDGFHRTELRSNALDGVENRSRVACGTLHPLEKLGNGPPKYVLITPARNEEAFIEKTLVAVASQTILPVRWVIVDDGSTDRTAEIVQSYVHRFPWIELCRREQRPDRSFAGK